MEIPSWGAELCAVQTTQQAQKLLFQNLLVRNLTTDFYLSITIVKMCIAMGLFFEISVE